MSQSVYLFRAKAEVLCRASAESGHAYRESARCTDRECVAAMLQCAHKPRLRLVHADGIIGPPVHHGFVTETMIATLPPCGVRSYLGSDDPVNQLTRRPAGNYPVNISAQDELGDSRKAVRAFSAAVRALLQQTGF